MLKDDATLLKKNKLGLRMSMTQKSTAHDSLSAGQQIKLNTCISAKRVSLIYYNKKPLPVIHPMTSQDIPDRRVIPKQERAKEIVRAVEEAGLQILANEGPDKITTARIAEIAGVSVGSLYRYFPNKEAIVGAIYAAKTAADIKFVEQIDPWLNELIALPICQAVRLIVQCTVARHRELFKLHGEFYIKHHRTFALSSRLSPTLIKSVVRKLLDRNKELLTHENDDMAIFLIARGLSGIVRVTLDEEPDYIFDEKFIEQLTCLTLRYLGLPEEELKNGLAIKTNMANLPAWVLPFLGNTSDDG
jgi:AcrR family transcriptional regulator